jgi:hypothetical protein
MGFPQAYIISTKYKTQQPLGFPQTYIISIKDKNYMFVGNPGILSFVFVFC